MEEKKEFFEKIVRIQSLLKAPKGQFNKFASFAYRSCEDIVEAVKPLLAKEKLILTISDEIVLIGERYYVKATAKIFDDKECITNIGYAREAAEKKGMDPAQITGATSSYSRKYALNGLLGIDDTKDADHSAPEVRPKRTAQPQNVMQQPQNVIQQPQATKESPKKEIPLKTLPTAEKTEPKSKSAGQRFLDAKKALGSVDYFYILGKYGVKSANALPKDKIEEVLKSLESVSKVSEIFKEGEV